MNDRRRSKPSCVCLSDLETSSIYYCSGTYRRNRIHLRKSNETPPGIRHRPDQASGDRTTRRDDRSTRRDDPMARSDDLMTRRDDPVMRRDDRTARSDDPMARHDDPTSREEVNESDAMNEPNFTSKRDAKK